MKARVLTVDAASSKATLTLKRTMLRDKREPLSCYDDVSNRDALISKSTPANYKNTTKIKMLRPSVARVEASVSAALALAGRAVLAVNLLSTARCSCDLVCADTWAES